jgi:hypothetical protein
LARPARDAGLVVRPKNREGVRASRLGTRKLLSIPAFIDAVGSFQNDRSIPEAYYAVRDTGRCFHEGINCRLGIRCPSSDELRHIIGLQKGGSRPSGFQIMREAVGAACPARGIGGDEVFHSAAAPSAKMTRTVQSYSLRAVQDARRLEFASNARLKERLLSVTHPANESGIKRAES